MATDRGEGMSTFVARTPRIVALANYFVRVERKRLRVGTDWVKLFPMNTAAHEGFTENVNDVRRAKEAGARDGSAFAGETVKGLFTQHGAWCEEPEIDFVMRNLQDMNRGDVWHWGSVARMQRRASRADVHGVYAEYYYASFYEAATARATDLFYSMATRA